MTSFRMPLTKILNMTKKWNFVLLSPVHTQNKNKEAKGNKQQRRRRQWPPYNLF